MRNKSKAGRKLLSSTKKAFYQVDKPTHEISDDDDFEFQEEDLELVKEFGSSINFLTSLKPEDLKKKPEKLPLPKSFRGELSSDEEDEMEIIDRAGNDQASQESTDSQSDSSGFEDVDSGDSDFEEEDDLENERPVKRIKNSEDGVDYESMATSTKWMQPEVIGRLPIKDDTGNLRHIKAPLVVDRVVGDELLYQQEKMKRMIKKGVEVNSKKKNMLIEKTFVEEGSKVVVAKDAFQDNVVATTSLEKQEKLAELANLIVSDPEKNLSLIKAIKNYTTDSSLKIQKLSLLTQLAVFRDIIPGYRIRKPTEKELSIAVSKDIKILRAYEEGLLAAYQGFLQSLDTCMKEANPVLEEVAIECYSQLLTSSSHFNFASNIIMAIIDRMTSPNPSSKTMDQCTTAIVHLLSNDVDGRASLDAVKLASKLTKTRKRIDPRVIDCFAHLKLGAEIKKAVSIPLKRKKNEIFSRSVKKVSKEIREIRDELREAEAVVDVEDRKKNHTATLSLVFVIYFRILKDEKAPVPTIEAVLRGICKFSHLINVELVVDVIAVMRRIIGRMRGLSSSIVFNAISTCFKIVGGQEVLNVDLKDFCEALYGEIINLAVKVQPIHKADDTGIFELALQSMDLMMIKRKEVGSDRVCAFMKRICSLCLHLPAERAFTCLNLVRSLFVKYPKLRNLLDIDEVVGTGVYDAHLGDPDLCNPFSTISWELVLLMGHYDPNVVEAAKRLSKGDFSRVQK